MSQSSGNHFLSTVLAACQKHSDKTALLPYDERSGTWSSVTFAEYHQALLVSANYWRNVLIGEEGYAKGSIIGLWLTGKTYVDSVMILGVSLAGFIPQVFSPLHSPIGLIESLMESSGATVLLYDKHFRDTIAQAIDLKLKHREIPEHESLPVNEPERIAPSVVSVKDTVFVFHSSGTTSKSGIPKVIPSTHAFAHHVAMATAHVSFSPTSSPLPHPQIMNTAGSWAHIATIMGFMTALNAGWTYAQSISFEPHDMLRLIVECKVNCLLVYAGCISELIRLAQVDSAAKDILLRLHIVAHTGWALPEADEEWAYANGIPIMSFYCTTETGPLMATTHKPKSAKEKLFLVYEGSGARFLPVSKTSDITNDMRPEDKLLEVVVSADANNSPHVSRISDDGFYHTEDLFEELYPGRYKYRGRYGDFIRTGMGGGLCDAKQLEDRIRTHCADLIEDCVVVGTYKPSPSVIVEVNDVKYEGISYRKEVVKHIMEFLEAYNPILFPWERVSDPKRIMIKTMGSLPRSKEKGNIRFVKNMLRLYVLIHMTRRLATETLLAEEIDALYI